MLIDKDMTVAEPQKEDRYSANIPTRLRNNSYVSLETMEIIVSVLDYKVDDIVDFVPGEGKK